MKLDGSIALGSSRIVQESDGSFSVQYRLGDGEFGLPSNVDSLEDAIQILKNRDSEDKNLEFGTQGFIHDEDSDDDDDDDDDYDDDDDDDDEDLDCDDPRYNDDPYDRESDYTGPDLRRPEY